MNTKFPEINLKETTPDAVWKTVTVALAVFYQHVEGEQGEDIVRHTAEHLGVFDDFLTACLQIEKAVLTQEIVLSIPESLDQERQFQAWYREQLKNGQGELPKFGLDELPF